MSIMHFCSATAAAAAVADPPIGNVVLNADSASGFNLVGFGSAYAAFTFSTNGVRIRVQDANSVNINGEWWSLGAQANIGNDYQIRGVLSSGSTPAGPGLGSTTWHNLSSVATWSLTRSVVGTTSSTISVSIRDSSTQTIQATALYTMEVVMEN